MYNYLFILYIICVLWSSSWTIPSTFAAEIPAAPSITVHNQYCLGSSTNSFASCRHGNTALKILVIPQNFPHPSLHGSDKRVFHILENLVGLGHFVSVVPFARTTVKLTEFDHYLLNQLQGKESDHDNGGSNTNGGSGVHSPHYLSYPTDKKPLLNSANPTDTFRKLLQQLQPDIVMIWLWFWDHRYTAPGLFGNMTAEYCAATVSATNGSVGGIGAADKQRRRRCRYLVFTDDAHSSRQTQLATQQKTKAAAARSLKRALKMEQMELEAYQLADTVVAITRTDQQLIQAMQSQSTSSLSRQMNAKKRGKKRINASPGVSPGANANVNANAASSGNGGVGSVVTTVRFVSSSWEELGLISSSSSSSSSVDMDSSKSDPRGSAALGTIELETDTVEGIEWRTKKNIAAPASTVQALPRFAERHGLVFVGNGKNPTNVQALKWYIHEVAPRLEEVLSERHDYAFGGSSSLEHDPNPIAGGIPLLTVIGGYWDKKSLLLTGVESPQYSEGDGDVSMHLLDKYINFTGYASTPEMLSIIDHSRVFVSPIVVSTGINTKNVLALSRGIVLTTTVAGAAGMCEVCDELKQKYFKPRPKQPVKHEQGTDTEASGKTGFDGDAEAANSGFGLTDEIPFLIAPSVEALVHSVISVYFNETNWQQYHHAGLQHVMKWFHKDASAMELDRVLFPGI